MDYFKACPGEDLSKTSTEPPLIKLECYSHSECPQIKNHTAIIYNKQIFIFGGYDGKKNHNTLYIYNIESKEWIKPSISGFEPPGRNGHTATLVDNKMYIIGGWLGSGPYAASDIYLFDLDNYVWSLPNTKGPIPGPCNMHSTDLIGRILYVFRGGNGREYLNDLHTFRIDENMWYNVETSGDVPPPRANHSSAVINQYLYIFGGWDGSKRLNDLYTLDTENLIWTEIKPKSILPSPRAGMTLCNIENELYLFGGSGPSSSCFNDLHIYNPEKNVWTLAESSNLDKNLKPRAGHTMTVDDHHLYIIGGSHLQNYFKDIYVLDTDPAPEFFDIGTESSSKRILAAMRDYCNNQELSDIKFIIEGKPFYGHKIVLSLLSEKFRSMFNSGMRENNCEEIVIPHISYPVFAAICSYLYSGEVEFGAETEGQELSLEYLLEFLTVSDEFMLEEIKLSCEKHLADQVNDKTFGKIYKYAEMCNAFQLKKYCEWFKRRFLEGSDN